MVMNRVGGFLSLGRSILDQFQGTPGTGAEASGGQATDQVTSRRQDPTVARPRGPLRTDAAEISAKAKRLNMLRTTIQVGKDALTAVPDVRNDRLAEVRSRLGQGFYQSVEVRRQVAERLGEVARRMEEL